MLVLGNGKALLFFLKVAHWEELVNLLGSAKAKEVVSEVFFEIKQALSPLFSFIPRDDVFVLALRDGKALRELESRVKVKLSGVYLSYPEDGQTLEELLLLGLIALSCVKEVGIFRMDKATLLNSLEFVLQPICDANSKVVSAEVLTRFRVNEKLLSLEPLFGTLQEERLLLEMDKLLWRKFLSSYPKLKSLGIRYNFNLTPVSIASDEFVELLVEKESIQVCLEITEQAKLSNDQKVLSNVQKLLQAGFRLAIDDFGVKHANLEYLRYLPVQEIKLDRTLIEDVDTNERTQALISSITSLCKKLGVSVCAEGVERATQFEALKSLGVGLFQGFFFSKPMSLKKIEGGQP